MDGCVTQLQAARYEGGSSGPLHKLKTDMTERANLSPRGRCQSTGFDWNLNSGSCVVFVGRAASRSNQLKVQSRWGDKVLDDLEPVDE